MERFKILSGSSLKVIAMITMLIDHTGIALAFHLPTWKPYYQIFRDIGRIAFPIYCFLLIEGFLHTRNRVKYARSLFILSLLSELPYDLVINAGRSIWHSQNVMFTLLIGLLVIWGLERCQNRFCLQFVISGGGLVLAYLMHTDYDWKGVLLILLLYLCRHDKFTQTVAGGACLYWEWKAIFAFIPINLYNGERGWIKGPAMKYAVYAFYPAHLLILALIRYSFVTTMLPVL